MVDWPKALIKDLARRRSVVFIGSGVSAHSTTATGQRPPMWRSLLESLCAEVQGPRAIQKEIRSLIGRSDFLTACEIIKNNVNAEQFTDLLKQTLQEPGFAPAEIHQHLVALDSRLVATPNYDAIYDTAARTKFEGNVSVKPYHDEDVAEAIRSASRVILKVHGEIETPGKIIFSRSDYARARSDFREFYLIWEALALTHTFLFVGCGLDDPDVRLLFEDYAFRHGSIRPHYFVVSKKAASPRLRVAVEKSTSFRILTYDAANNHAELVESLKKLAEAVKTARDDLVLSQDW